MAEPIGALRVELSANWAQLESTFNKASKKTKGLGKTFGTLGKALEKSIVPMAAGMAALGAGIAATAAAMALATKQTIDYADKIGTLAERSGLSTDFLQKLQFAAEQDGDLPGRRGQGEPAAPAQPGRRHEGNHGSDPGPRAGLRGDQGR